MWEKSIVDQKREIYDKAMLDIEKFTTLEEFNLVIKTIDHMLFVTLKSDQYLKKRHAVQQVQKHIIKSFEDLKEEITSHPNYIIAQKNAEQKKIQQEIESQWMKIASDEQFIARIESIIPNDTKITNRHDFIKKFIKKLFINKIFDSTILYWEYERHRATGSVVAVFDFLDSLDMYVVLVNAAYGYDEKNIYMYSIEKKFCVSKDPIKPSIHFSHDYIESKLKKTKS